MATGVPARLSPAEGRKFGLHRRRGVPRHRGDALVAGPTTARVPYVGGLGAVLVLAGLLVPTLLGPVNRAWMGLAHLISKVTTPIFMGIVYFLVLTPIGLGMRLFGRRPLVHAAQGDRATGSTAAPAAAGARATWNVNSDSRMQR